MTYSRFTNIFRTSLAILAFCLCAQTIWAGTVYLAIRTDGVSGSGLSSADPFDCSGAKFDAVMGTIPPNTTINLAPGIYSSLGSDAAWTIQSGWTINGAGEGVTTIRLATNFNPAMHKHQVLANTTGANVGTNIVIENLTLDANYQNMKPTGNNQYDAWCGVSLYASNSVVQNVETINCYGIGTQGIEEFSINLCGGTNDKEINCLTHHYASGANYTNGCGYGTCTQSVIQGCTDDGGVHGFNLSNNDSGITVSGCTTTFNTGVGLYSDTGSISDITIENNHFSASSFAIQNSVPLQSTNVTIANNTFATENRCAIGLTGIPQSDVALASANLKAGAKSFTVSSVTGTIPNPGICYYYANGTTLLASSYTLSGNTITLTNGGSSPGSVQASSNGSVSVHFFNVTGTNFTITGNTFTSQIGTTDLVQDNYNSYFPMTITDNIYSAGFGACSGDGYEVTEADNGPQAVTSSVGGTTETGASGTGATGSGTTGTGSSGGTSTTTTSYAAWQAQYYSAAQLADPTISGPTATPYGSGIPNLLVYALQLNPATVEPTQVPAPTRVNGHLQITFLEPASVTDINYIVEVSRDLINWKSGTGYTMVVSSEASAGGTAVTVQDALPTNTAKRFMRLRVTQL